MKRRKFLNSILLVPAWKIIDVDFFEMDWNQGDLIPSFEKFIVPVISKAYPPMLIDELVSVQPMSTPSTQSFYIDFVTTSKPDEMS